MCASRARAARGFSLIELILAMVIVGISLAAVMSVFVVTTRHSADPMATQQAQLIAEAYLDEILLKRFYDPDTNNVCPAAAETRAAYDNVCDYHGLNQAPTDQFGNPIAALSAYNVSISVTTSGVSLHTGGDIIDNTSQIIVLLVTITVTGPNNTTMTLNGYRTNYECNSTGGSECKSL